jgi:hypothetical protein
MGQYKSDFQIICTTCGCLSVKIEEPLKSSRDAIVYCGECGIPRGTVGALRDLSVQQSPEIAFQASSPPLSAGEGMSNEPEPAAQISTQYAELQRLRQQVKIAEWLAGESQRALRSNPVLKEDARHFAIDPSATAKRYIRDKRDQKTPG